MLLHPGQGPSLYLPPPDAPIALGIRRLDDSAIHDSLTQPPLTIPLLFFLLSLLLPLLALPRGFFVAAAAAALQPKHNGPPRGTLDHFFFLCFPLPFAPFLQHLGGFVHALAPPFFPAHAAVDVRFRLRGPDPALEFRLVGGNGYASFFGRGRVAQLDAAFFR